MEGSQVDSLKRLAQEAKAHVIHGFWSYDGRVLFTDTMAQFFKVANPSTVLDLIAEIEKLRQERDVAVRLAKISPEDWAAVSRDFQAVGSDLNNAVAEDFKSQLAAKDAKIAVLQERFNELGAQDKRIADERDALAATIERVKAVNFIASQISEDANQQALYNAFKAGNKNMLRKVQAALATPSQTPRTDTVRMRTSPSEEKTT